METSASFEVRSAPSPYPTVLEVKFLKANTKTQRLEGSKKKKATVPAGFGE
jgi:hypothetical protein